MLTQLDIIFMRQAIGHAYDGHGLMRSQDQIARPSVGCLIVSKEGKIAGFGHTSEGGKPHAEPNALEMAGDKALGSTAYVTLEPCSHDSAGKIACVKHVVAAGVSRVVIGFTDMHNAVNGKGIEYLQQHGLEVVVCTGDLSKAAFEAHRPFFLHLTVGRPYIGLIANSALLALNDNAKLVHQSVLSLSKASIKKAGVKSGYEAEGEEFFLGDSFNISIKNTAESGITKLLITDNKTAVAALANGLWDEAHTFSGLEGQPQATVIYSKYVNIFQAGREAFPKEFHHLIP